MTPAGNTLQDQIRSGYARGARWHDAWGRSR